MDRGADIEISDNYRTTPLQIAAQQDQWDIVRFLERKGADIKVSDNYGITPLHWAAKK